MPRYRIGVDVGGTFTDAVVLDEESGMTLVVKVPTTPDDPSLGFMTALARAIERFQINPNEVGFLAHATTIATNSIIAGGCGVAGLIATEGFRDVLEIARQARPALYDVFYDKPASLIPRHLCIGVPERMDANGSELVPLDQAAVREAGAALAREGVESIVICFLHSYRDPSHERRAGELLAEICPDIPVCLSSDICPEYREYWRASTAAVNAVLLPVVGRYIERLDRHLEEARVESELYLMASGGGIVSSRVARHQPVQLIESGPAAGVIAAAEVGVNAGLPNLISIDIGGTTAKTALVQNGRATVSNEFEIGGVSLATTTRTRGRGYPVKIPVIDLVEIGAGGGSIGWVDPGGALSVGPQSAGAEPGPACYGKGGAEPTLTDAQIILGRINPDNFLGGEQRLFPQLAAKAVRERIAERLGLRLEEAALGMIEIANAKMSGALELVSIQKGIDPRGFTLVAFGGSGPLHAVELSSALGIERVLVPPAPGVASAWGLLSTDLRHTFSRSYIADLNDIDLSFVKGCFDEFRGQSEDILTDEGVIPANVTITLEIDVRYRGQSYELSIPYPQTDDRAELINIVTESFLAAHEHTYGFAARGQSIEIVNLRLEASGAVPRPRTKKLERRRGTTERAHKETRSVVFPTGSTECAIYDRYELGAGDQIGGPAIIEESDSTTLVPLGYTARVDNLANLLIRAD